MQTTGHRSRFSWLTASHIVALLAATLLCIFRFDTASAVLVSASVLCIVLARIESIVDFAPSYASEESAAGQQAQDRLLIAIRRQALLASLMMRIAEFDAPARSAWIERCAGLARQLDAPGPDIDMALHALRDEILPSDRSR